MTDYGRSSSQGWADGVSDRTRWDVTKAEGETETDRDRSGCGHWTRSIRWGGEWVCTKHAERQRVLALRVIDRRMDEVISSRKPGGAARRCGDKGGGSGRYRSSPVQSAPATAVQASGEWDDSSSEGGIHPVHTDTDATT